MSVAPLPAPEAALRKPDFFLVGAPKCGTTALAHYLAGHPSVFVSSPKEPNYFARHLTVGRWRAEPPVHQASLDGYLALFRDAGEEHLAVGEASTRTLRSPIALAELRRFQPAARLIVQLRSPIELARSWHGQKLWEGQEDERDFAAAWRLQRGREEGRDLPRGLTASDALLYGKVASLGGQLREVLRLFAREQVLVLFHDDMRRDTGAVYEETLAFLGVPSDGRTHFPVLNASQQHRWPRLAERLRRRPAWTGPLVGGLRRLRGLAGAAAVGRAPARVAPRPPLPPALHAELADYFAPEVELLEALTGRDLRHWLKP